MLKYLIVLLDDTSTPYCHYENPKTEYKLISLQDLRAAILLAMKENLMVQFVYPDYKLPQKYEEIIETTEHCKIMPVALERTLSLGIIGRIRKVERWTGIRSTY